MKRTLSPRDIELLSLYLDQHLETGQRARMEARLRADAELRTAYQELRQTRTLLRSLPRLKAPRNFTLTPEMVGLAREKASPPRRIYPVFQFASALASVLLVLVLLGDFLGFGLRPAGALTQTEAANALQPTPAGEESLERMTGEEEAPAAEGAPLQAAPEASEPGVGGGLETFDAQSKAITETFSALITSTIPLSGTAPLTMTAPISPGAEIAMEAQADETGGAPGWALPERSLWRAAEISLATLAIASGLAAVYLRKRHIARE
jgi:hypothetical protein